MWHLCVDSNSLWARDSAQLSLHPTHTTQLTCSNPRCGSLEAKCPFTRTHSPNFFLPQLPTPLPHFYQSSCMIVSGQLPSLTEGTITHWWLSATVGTKSWGHSLVGQLYIYQRKVWPIKRCQTFPITWLPLLIRWIVDLRGEFRILHKHWVWKESITAEFRDYLLVKRHPRKV